MFDDPERYEHDGFYEEDTDYEDEYETDDSCLLYTSHRIYSVVFIFVKFIPKFALCRFLLIFIKRRFKLHNSKIMIIIMIF